MEDSIILTKLFILIYCGIKYSSGNLKSVTLVILVILFYVSINMLYHIVKTRKNKCFLSCISIALIIFAALFLNPLFIMLLALNIIEVIFLFNTNILLPSILIFTPIFIINSSIRIEYLLISYLTLMVCILSNRLKKKTADTSYEIDILREKNYSLIERLSKDSDYEKQVIYSSQLEERNKIAQEIHDRIGHTLSGSLMQLEASKILIKDDLNKAQEMIDGVIIALRNGMESIRATLRNIKPASEQMGINRLKLLFDEFSINNNIKVAMKFSGDLERASHNHWKVLYDNSKEALTNAVKYSKATVINVNVEVLNKLLKMEIKDNGVGAYTIKRSLGLSGIEERTVAVGGKIILDGSNGFSIITLLPIGG